MSAKPEMRPEPPPARAAERPATLDDSPVSQALAATGLPVDRPRGADERLPDDAPVGANPGQASEHDEGHAVEVQRRLAEDPPARF